MRHPQRLPEYPVGHRQRIADLLELVAREGMPTVPIDTRPLDEVDSALTQLRAGKVIGRIVLTGAA